MPFYAIDILSCCSISATETHSDSFLTRKCTAAIFIGLGKNTKINRSFEDLVPRVRVLELATLPGVLEITGLTLSIKFFYGVC